MSDIKYKGIPKMRIKKKKTSNEGNLKWGIIER